MKKIFKLFIIFFSIFILLGIETSAITTKPVSIEFDEVLKEAKIQSYDIQIADFDVFIAKQGIRTARSVYFPKINASVGTEYTKNFRDYTNSMVTVVGDAFVNPYTRFQSLMGITLSYNVFDFGVRKGKLDIAKEDVVDNAKYLSKEYHGDDKNNFVYVNSSMYVDEVYAGKGDDTYIIDSLAKSTSINDIAGDDAIVVNSNQKDVNLIFNVFRRLPEYETEDSGMIDVRPLDGSGPIEFYDLFILSDSNLNKMIKMNATGKEIPISNVSVYDYFSQRGELQQGGAPIDYKIETIETKDGSVVTYSDLDAVRNSIGLWLSTKVNEDGTYKYDCALDVLSKQDKGDMEILLAYYDSVWSDQPGVLPQ